MSKFLNQLTDIACRAGDEIMRIYDDAAQSAHVDYKADNSPLTLADRRSHEIIVEALSQQFPSVPILSEEGISIDYATRKQWPSYWLIDPLDGTKEFINRNGEFTVNIALVEQKSPVLGVVYAPALARAFCGSRETGAYVVENGGVKTLRVNDRRNERIAVRSKSHASPEEDSVLAKYDVVDCISIGSSLKFCLVAEGKADVYYRHGPTMEWDVGAGQAVVQAAGGKVYAGVGPDEFLLNKENLLNGSFLCLGGGYYQV
jgi:3'(2'), 5'-bisphosphate nucleotidase